ncbi:MAG: hypothetical protein IJH37_05005 [Clostridia bacterium]|nr:hypothetical protein [Clostridia bacterium]
MAIGPLKKNYTIATPGAVASGEPKVTMSLGDTSQQLGDTIATGPGSVSMSLDDYVKIPKIGVSSNQSESGSAPSASVPPAPSVASTVKPETGGGYKIAGNTSGNLAGVRDYVGSKGYGGAVDWDGENVLVGGQPIKPAKVVDGTAYVDPAVLDVAIDNYEKKNGIKQNRAVSDDYMNNYGSRLEELLRPLTEREQFSYDPEKDEAFKRYRELMLDNADRAYESVINSRGNIDGGTLSAANAARNEYLRKIDEALLDFRDRALTEFESETGRRRNNLSDAYSLFNDFYNKEYTANRDQIGDTLTANRLSNDERQTDFNNDVTLRRLLLELAGSSISNEQALESLRSSIMENRMNQAYSRGYLTPEDARFWGLDSVLHENEYGQMVNPDGSLYIPWQPENLYGFSNNYITSYGQQAGANQGNREFGQLSSQLTEQNKTGIASPYSSVLNDFAQAYLGRISGAASPAP